MDENYLVQTVKEDLIFLKDTWTQDIDDASLRRSSNVLRSLLIHGNLQKVWKIAGFEKQPKITAPDLMYVILGEPKLRINFACAGGAHYKGMIISSLCEKDLITNRDRKKYLEGLSEEKTFGLSEFCESPCMLITKRYPTGGLEQGLIKRREVIHYIADKMGGTHIDLKRNIKKEQNLILLDWIYHQYQIAEKNSIYFELLSIGQHLIKSEDVQMLIEKI